MSEKTAKKKTGTYVAPCRCASEYQDAKYGKGNRVYNAGGSEKLRGRCTVCGRED